MKFTERLFQKTDVRSFYGRHTDLRELPGKSECKGLCPLHKEKTPSFFVNLESGSFNCFGCGLDQRFRNNVSTKGVLAQQIELRHPKEFKSEFGLLPERIEDESGKLVGATFKAKSQELLSAFQSIAKLKRIPLPFTGPQQLGLRLFIEEKILKEAGWTKGDMRFVQGDRRCGGARWGAPKPSSAGG
ncbi:MAG: CHC2 zinc finger domain-containing protein [Acidobacteriota bacterium]